MFAKRRGQIGYTEGGTFIPLPKEAFLLINQGTLQVVVKEGKLEGYTHPKESVTFKPNMEAIIL